jgi:potassium efflux system protein
VDGITLEQIDVASQAAQASAELTDDQKKEIEEFYKRAREQLGFYKQLEERITELQQTIDYAPERLAKRKAKVGTPFIPFEPDPNSETVAELEQKLAQEVEKLKNSEKKLEDLEKEPKRRADRTKELGETNATVRDRIRKLEEELATKPAEGESPELTAAKRALLRAKMQVIGKEEEANKKELAMFAATSEVLPIDRDLAIRTVTRYQQRIEIANKAINLRRTIDAENQRREALLAAQNAAKLSPVCKEIAEKNAELAAQRRPLIQNIGETTTKLSDITPKLAKLKLQSKLIREKIDTGGLTEQTGEILRNQQQELPNLEMHRKSISKAQESLTRTQLRIIDLDAQRTGLVDVGAVAESMILAQGKAKDAPDYLHIYDAAKKLLDAQRVYADTLIADSKSYVEALTILLESEKELLTEAEAFADYIAERILWVKSGSPIDRSDFRQTAVAARWFISVENWKSAVTAITKDFFANIAIYALFAIGFVACLFFIHGRGRRTLRAIGADVQKNYVFTTTLTLYAFVLTFVVAAIWPLAVAFVGWRLRGLIAESPFAAAVGNGLMMVAYTFFALEVLRQICRHNGIADAHFRWKAKSLLIIRRNLYALLVLEIPLVFIVASLESWRTITKDSSMSHSLGRLAFIAGMLVLARFTHKIFTPKDGVLQDILSNLQGGWMDRGRVVLHPIAVLTPIALSLVAGMGYYYSAQKTSERLLATVLLGAIVIMGNALMLRWLFAVRGRLAIEQARKRKAAEQEAENNESTEESSIPVPMETSVGFAFLMGLWLIWAPFMPALKILEQVQVWSSTATVAKTTTTPEGVPETKTFEEQVPVDLADLIKASVLAFATFIAAQNIPGLLEITLLTRLPLDAGGRYATAKLASYVIVLMGMVLIANLMGIGWSNVQWLAAAVSVGLGFGLQEIFANFVSGLIILFERPIRVGDLVTVNDRSGTISKIRIRATTIVDFDRKEVIVPNKAFITDQIHNWTLTDRVVRMAFEVGVAYGSDTELARSLMLKIAGEHPRVLKDPAPQALFDGFGDSTLNLILRVFVCNIDYFLITRHEINTAIDREFREHNIEIAFPQREIHVHGGAKSIPMLEAASRRA